MIEAFVLSLILALVIYFAWVRINRKQFEDEEEGEMFLIDERDKSFESYGFGWGFHAMNFYLTLLLIHVMCLSIFPGYPLLNYVPALDTLIHGIFISGGVVRTLVGWIQLKSYRRGV